MKSGFTIIELMISMTILSFISLFVYQNTSRSFVLRETLTQDGDFYNSVRVALDTLGRDIVHIYTPQAAALPGELGKAPKAQQPGQAPPELLSPATYDFWGMLVNKNGVRPSRFNGDEKKVSFVSNSHMRLFHDTDECEFSKIKYALEDDTLSKDSKKVFVKRENTEVFSLDRENKDLEVRYVLLTGVKDVRFQYLDGEKDSWSKNWDTTSMDHKNKFPSLIKIEIDLELPKTGNTFTVLQQYRPELTL